MTEVGWFIAYETVGEQQPWIALVPALGFVATIAGFALTLGRKPRERLAAAAARRRDAEDSRA